MTFRFERALAAAACAIAALTFFDAQPPAAAAADAAAPSARDVVVRGRTRLSDALRLAIHGRAGAPEATSVVLVVDVTPYTKQAQGDLCEALADIEDEALTAVSWRVAALGEPAGESVPLPAALKPQLTRLLATESTVTDTFPALRRTLRSVRDERTAVVYLADWRIDDDRDAEALIDALASRGQRLSVIGGEAAFERGWNDGFFAWRRSLRAGDLYDARIGRAPFGPDDPDAPWHGGDTAYPHIPTHWGGAGWNTEFAPSAGRNDRGRVEDLRERMSERPDDAPMSLHPLPSSWGAYALTRVAAVTRGRYVLWSWNPRGRSDVTYDYARCDLFAPDLRSRDVIRADVSRRPLAKALDSAWHRLADARRGVARVTPPLADDHRRGLEMEELRPSDSEAFAFAWPERERHRAFLRLVPDVLRDLDQVLDGLATAIAATDERPDDVDLRYLADAHLLRHIVLAQRFSLGEALAAARRVKDSAWDEPGIPCIQPVVFLAPEHDPEAVRARTDAIDDHARGDALVADRKALLRRYGGTPFGESAARNGVNSWEPSRMNDFAEGAATGRSPADSGDPRRPPDTPPGGGSSGSSGPGTGR